MIRRTRSVAKPPKQRPKVNKYAATPEFLEAASSNERTLLDEDALWVLWQACQNTAGLGIAAEVGAYRGGSADLLAAALRHANGADVEFHTVDTFEGHPAERMTDVDQRQSAGHFATSYDDVAAHLSRHPRVTVHRGEFTKVDLPDGPYAVVHVDVDLYRPALDCLQWFAPRLAAGGVLILDDFGSVKCAGVRAAVAEFLPCDGIRVWHPNTEQLIFERLG